MLQGMDYDIEGVNLNELIKIGEWISKEIGRHNGSKVGVAKLKQKKQ